MIDRDDRIGPIINKAAKSALFSWRQSEDGLEDLVNEVWVWYLESPATQEKLSTADVPLARKLVYKAALQILAKSSLSADRFNGRNIYSSDNIKDALRKQSNNRYLLDILPRALKALSEQNAGQAEAIRTRYEDGVVPARGSAAEAKLKRSVKSLTENVNIIAITAGVDAYGNVNEGPGSRSAVFPETRRAKGARHPDPTGETAIMLIEHPELRDEYLREDPIQDFLAGRSCTT